MMLLVKLLGRDVGDEKADRDGHSGRGSPLKQSTRSALRILRGGITELSLLERSVVERRGAADRRRHHSRNAAAVFWHS